MKSVTAWMMMVAIEVVAWTILGQVLTRRLTAIIAEISRMLR